MRIALVAGRSFDEGGEMPRDFRLLTLDYCATCGSYQKNNYFSIVANTISEHFLNMRII